MALTLTSPVTGGAQTGFTSPTYTLMADVGSTPLIKRWVVLALGGTQAGVDTHSASKQFAIEVERPAAIKQLGAPGLNGQIANVPSNKYKVVTLKSVIPASGQLPRGMVIRTEFSVPAGSETYDGANVKAALAVHIGSLNQLSAGIGDTVATGVS